MTKGIVLLCATALIIVSVGFSKVGRGPRAGGVQSQVRVIYGSKAADDGKAVFSVAMRERASGGGKSLELTTARITEYDFLELDHTTKPAEDWDATISVRAGPYFATAANTVGSWNSVTESSQIQITFGQ